MSSDDNEQNPFTRPAFVSAAIVVGLVVVLGAVLGIKALTAGNKDTAAAPTPSASPTATATQPSPNTGATEASVCGLSGAVMAGTLSTAPAAVWAYEGTTAYPTSKAYGPGATDGDGVRYCFQHSPAGAVFAAANAVVQGSDPAVSASWVKYAIGEGPFRTQLLAESGTASSSNPRMSIAGFRLLSYNGRAAEVDIAVRSATGSTTVTASGVYMLVWQGGDWKLSADVAKSLDVAPIPDLAGYVFWGA
jgi:hypothetical protein